MDPDHQIASVPSTSNSATRQLKAPQESNASVAAAAAGKPPPRSKDTSEANAKKPSNKGKRNRRRKEQPKQQPANAMRPDPMLREGVKKLHDRTKHVKSKLARMKQAMAPDSQTQDITEQEILQEIERLQRLVQEMRLRSAPGQRKISTDIQNEDPTEELALQAAGDSKKNEKTPKGRQRTKSKRESTGEKDLQKLYESHINRIVRGTKEEDPKFAELQFKLGDDLEKFAQRCVEEGLGHIVEAEVRVNAKNNHQAFLTLDSGPDAIISSMAARKYAMEGDVVSAFVRNPPDGTKTSVGDAEESIEPIVEQIDDVEAMLISDFEMLRATETTNLPLTRQAFVIRLVKEIGNREFIGSISFKNPTKLECGDFYKFKPRDMKVPMIYIPIASCEEVLDKKKKSDDSLGFLYIAQVTEIKDNGRCIGKLISAVGKCGDLTAEIKAILLHNNLRDVEPYEERFEKMWAADETTQTIAAVDLKDREDLRKECIFTIDPLTARDLDDAVSCKSLDNGHYEIGVHISDVTRFLDEKSELDELVKLRATSIYLVNEVIHMLPQSLCMRCSLLPNEDKFALSVFWVMDQNAEIISTRFTRSIIRSCTQFAYEHAQKIIDNPNEAFTEDDFPTICNGFTVSDIVERVLTLNTLAEIMRKRRFENGSLSIDKPQFYFQFDPKSGEPINYAIASRLTANFLIEEFMLQANQSVAQFIYKRFPDIAILRTHQPPKASAVRNLKAKLSAVGIELDMSNSKSIFNGLASICGASSTPEVISAGMNYLLTKPMMRAKYFCSENVEREEELRHYALAIPIYTHFTSPIRRYPDILVHRLLSAALDYTSPPKRTPDELHILARICNDQKFNAKNAGEESSNLFFLRYLKAKKSINLKAVVTDIYRHSLEVITLETGHLVSIQFKLQKVVVDASKAPAVVLISEKNSTKPPVELKMFSALDVKLVVWEGKLAGFFVSPDRAQRVKNSILASIETEEMLQKRLQLKAAKKRNARKAFFDQ